MGHRHHLVRLASYPLLWALHLFYLARPHSLQIIRDSTLDPLSPIDVDVDTLTFDRVLLFLESRACEKEPPAWSLHLIDDLNKVWSCEFLMLAFVCLVLSASSIASRARHSFVVKICHQEQHLLLSELFCIVCGMILPLIACF